MTKGIQMRRGTTSQHSSFVGREGEITVDTVKQVVVIHDNLTAGGHPLVSENIPQTVTNKTIIAGSGTTTGTSSQPLQVTGGAYVSGNLGVGNTNPQTKLQVDGVLGFNDTNTRIGDNTTGASITSGTNNNFIGVGAGYITNTGSSNNFFGVYAGFSNQNGSNNIFLGNGAGYSNNSGSQSVFLGLNAGLNNSSGGSNNFFGVAAGISNQTGSNNIFLGARNGISASASYKVIIGSGYLSNYFDSPSTTKDYQFAVGIRTDANASKYWLVGNENFNVGIGTTNPTSPLHVVGKTEISGPLNLTSLSLAGGTTTVPPLQFALGTNLATPAGGAVEFDGTSFFVTQQAATTGRGMVLAPTIIRTNSTITHGANNNLESIFDAANDVINLSLDTLYWFRGVLLLNKAVSASGNNLVIEFQTTWPVQSITYQYETYTTAGAFRQGGNVTVTSSTALDSLGTASFNYYVKLEGWFRSHATLPSIFQPRFAQNAGSVQPTVSPDSWLMLQPMASGNPTLLAGSWA